MLPPWKKSYDKLQFSSVQFSRSVMSDSLRPMNHSTPGLPVHHQLLAFTQTHAHRVGDAIQPSHPLSSPSPPAPNPSPASGSFPMSQLFAWDGPKYWSFSFNISPSNEHPGLISFRMDWLGLLAGQGTLKSLLHHHSSKASIFWCSAFFTVQTSHPYMTTGKTMALTRWTFVGKVMSLLFNMLSRLIITFLPRSKHLLILWLQSLSAVILEPQRIKSDMEPDAMILVFWMLSFKPTFSLSSFTFIKRLFSSSSLSAIRMVSSAYLRLLVFLPVVLIPACASSSPAFLMMYSAYKLNKQGDNIQPWRTPFSIWNQSDKLRQHIKKQKHHFANKRLHSQSFGFSSSHVWMWELDHKEGWGLKNWCLRIVVLEKTQGDHSSQSERKSMLNTHWKNWCCSSNTVATWCNKLTHWERPWYWERSETKGEEGGRGWNG